MISRSSIARSNFAGILGSLVMLGIMFFYTAYVYAGQASLAWDANTESILGGYQLYYGQGSLNYTANVDVGNKTSYTLTGLQDGKTYYFAVKAYSVLKTTWSGYSKEVSKTIPSTSSTSAPTAIFSASRTSGTAPVAVTFTDFSTGNITAWSWEFGDGTTSIAKNASKSYSNPGTYTVSHTVSGPGGSNTATKSNYISVTAPSPSPIGGGSGGSGSSSGGGDTLVAAYNFGEASGTTVVDASGKGNHGTISGATRITQGKFGKALSFDGVNDWVTVNDSNSLDLSTGMTLEAWVYPTVFTSYWSTILHKETNRYFLMAGSNQDTPAVGGIFTTGMKIVYAGSSLPVNTWTHVAVTYDSARVRLYINGTEVASQAQTAPLTTSSGALRVGGTQAYGEYFQGWIDEVRIYNRALGATEIESDMTHSVGTSSP